MNGSCFHLFMDEAVMAESSEDLPGCYTARKWQSQEDWLQLPCPS